jgi:sulfofructose kinase
MAANASVAAVRLGAKGRLWSRVGGDMLGTRIVAELRAEGVDVTGVRPVPNCRSTSILVDDAGERLICTYNDPALDTDPGWLPINEIADADAVLTDVKWPEGSASVLDQARERGIPAVLDADIGPAEVLRDLATRATHAVFSKPGLALAASLGDAGAALARLAKSTQALVGVTLGADGFLYREQGRERYVAAPAIQAVDTLAAGDVWHAAFTLALAERRDVPNAARFANVAAALKCTRPGGRSGATTRFELDAALLAD